MEYTHKIVSIAPSSDWYSGGRSRLLGRSCSVVRDCTADYQVGTVPVGYMIADVVTATVVDDKSIAREIRIRGVKLEPLVTVPANALVTADDDWDDNE